jgi:HEAT repeat protein
MKHPDPMRRHLAAETLGKIGPGAQEAVPALAEAVQDEVGAVHVYAAAALLRIDRAAAIDALGKALQASSAWVREDAARALGDVGPAARPAIPLLQQALRDQATSVREAAALALRRISEG